MNGLYEWVDRFKLSRPKKNIARDFSDGVLVAELMAQIYPTWVDLSLYPTSDKIHQKINNWNLLQRKILGRIKCKLTEKLILEIVHGVLGAVEVVLLQIKKRTENRHTKRMIPSIPTPRILKVQQIKPTSEKIIIAKPLKMTIHTAIPSCPTSQVESKKRERLEMDLPLDKSMEKALPLSSPGKRPKISDVSSESPQKTTEESSMDDQDIVNDSDTPHSNDSNNVSTGNIVESPTEVEAVITEDLEQTEAVQYILSTSFVASLQLDSEQQSNEAGEKTAEMPTPLSVRVKREGKRTLDAAFSHDKSEKSTCSEKLEQIHIADAEQTGQAPKTASPDKTGRHSLRLFFSPTVPLSSEKPLVIPSGLYMLQTPLSIQKNEARRPELPITASLKHLTKSDFLQESSFVFFRCEEKANPLPQKSFPCELEKKNDGIQVARIVKCMNTGDCLVQLFKAVTPSRDSITQSKIVYISTPHFIECSSAQLTSIQRMEYDDVTGEWEWYQESENSQVVMDLLSQKDSKSDKKQRPVPYVTEILQRFKYHSISDMSPEKAVVLGKPFSFDRIPKDSSAREGQENQFKIKYQPTIFPKVQVQLKSVHAQSNDDDLDISMTTDDYTPPMIPPTTPHVPREPFFKRLRKA